MIGLSIVLTIGVIVALIIFGSESTLAYYLLGSFLVLEILLVLWGGSDKAKGRHESSDERQGPDDRT